MDRFITHAGRVLPMDRENVDTDTILPKQFLRSIRRTGFGAHLFEELRYRRTPGGAGREPDPSFILNDPRYGGASILLARRNFGCGSSREHAVWALQQYGFRVLLAPSFADIFHTNCFKNGVLPIVLPEPVIDRLFIAESASPALKIGVDLEQQVVLALGEAVPFDVPTFQKFCLLGGYDDIALTLRHAERVRAFESRRLASRPWLVQSMTASTKEFT